MDVSSIIDAIFPVGALYITLLPEKPAWMNSNWSFSHQVKPSFQAALPEAASLQLDLRAGSPGTSTPHSLIL
jgi:hypothetical protein